ncbi:MAG: glycosyltransferase [Acidimicrobiales bacterium]
MEPSRHDARARRDQRVAPGSGVVTLAPGVVVAAGRLWRLTPPARRVLEADRVRRRGGDLAALRPLIAAGLLVPRFRPVAPAAARDAIDVVIPVRDDAAGLAHCLGELVGWRVTVVDDGSRDAGAVARLAAGAGARLVRRDRAGGPGVARAEGARRATRAVVWFLDADVRVGDAAAVARRLLAHLGDPRVGAVAPRVRGPGGPRARDAFERDHSPLDLGPAGGLVDPAGPVPFVPSACLLVRRELATGFDPDLRVGEDVDWEWRLAAAGWRVRYDADVVVTHPPRPSWSAWWRQRVSYGASLGPLAQHHGARTSPWRLGPTTGLAAAILLAQPAWAAVEATLLAGRLGRTAPELAPPARWRLVVRAGGGAVALARATVRLLGPALLVLGRHRGPRVWALGTLARFGTGPRRWTDVPLGVADDTAAAVGRWLGAARARRLAPLLPAWPGGTRDEGVLTIPETPRGRGAS